MVPRISGSPNKRMKLTKSAPGPTRGAAFAAYARCYPD